MTAKIEIHLNDAQHIPSEFYHLDQIAYRIQNDQEAIQIAHNIALSFKAEASIRDHERRLPLKEIQAYKRDSSLFAIWTMGYQYSQAIWRCRGQLQNVG